LDNFNSPIIAIYGPTAVGKSKYAVDLALHYPGSVIISADAFQIYKGLDIGTAKLSIHERKGVPHELIDTHSFKDSFSVGAFLSHV